MFVLAKQSFGEYLKEVRISNNLSITKLAEVSGFSRPYLSQIESGHKKPTLEVLKRLSESLNVRYSVLLEKAGYEELAKGQMLLELQRQRLAEENQPSRISTPKENLKGGDGMIRYEQITPRQAVEFILQGKSDEIYVETIGGLREVNQKEILVTHIGNVNWFIRIEQNESK